MSVAFEGLVETCLGPTFVKTIGRGPLVFAVHGGPGFDHRYLVPVVECLAGRRTVVLFDQPGCGSSPTPPGGPTAEATFRHFRSLARRLGGHRPVGLFAHSWGALVAIASCALDEPAAPFAEGLLVNPTPVAHAGYEACRNNLLQRLPPETLAEAMRIAETGGDGSRIMELILPYYHGRAPEVPLTPFALHTPTYLAVNAGLTDFDYGAGLAAMRNVTVVMGDKDFTTPDLVGDVAAAAAHAEIMPGIGHFPFFEDRRAFACLVARAFPV